MQQQHRWPHSDQARFMVCIKPYVTRVVALRPCVFTMARWSSHLRPWPVARQLRERLQAFMDRYLLPYNAAWHAAAQAGNSPPLFLEDLKALVRKGDDLPMVPRQIRKAEATDPGAWLDKR